MKNLFPNCRCDPSVSFYEQEEAITDQNGQNNKKWLKFYKVKGNISYYVEPTIIGDAPYQKSVISINAFESKRNKIPIPVKMKWYRIKDKRKYAL